jgi:hypothetical protein
MRLLQVGIFLFDFKISYEQIYIWQVDLRFQKE